MTNRLNCQKTKQKTGNKSTHTYTLTQQQITTKNCIRRKQLFLQMLSCKEGMDKHMKNQQ